MKSNETRVDALKRVALETARRLYWCIRRPRFLEVFGPPGSGKGTLCKELAPLLGIAHLSTGDVFRRHIAAQTSVGRLAKSYIDAGQLVPDDVTVALVRQELLRPAYWKGALFDGFPRNLLQAELLDELLAKSGTGIERAIVLDVDEDTLVWRLSNRRTCSNQSCGRTYHLQSKPPQVPGICDVCKSALYQRPDDVPEAISARLSTYRTVSEPVGNFYAGKAVVIKPTRDTTEQEVVSQVTAALSGRRE